MEILKSLVEMQAKIEGNPDYPNCKCEILSNDDVPHFLQFTDLNGSEKKIYTLGHGLYFLEPPTKPRNAEQIILELRNEN